MEVIKETPPTVETRDDSGPASFIGTALGLVLIAMIGYMVYAFNHNAPSVTDMNAQQSQSGLSPAEPPTRGPAPFPQ